ncbi:MAG: trypsin-like peptidase domain-containing protein [Crocinitomicaceae bacterium]
MTKATLTTFATGFVGAITGVAITFSLLSNQPDQQVQKTEHTPVLQSSVFDVSYDDDKQLTANSTAYPDLTLAAEQTVESVVHIQTKFVTEEITFDPFLKLFYGEDGYRKRQRHGQASGSGVVISPEGYIVTNNHVVQDAQEVTVNLNQKIYPATIIGTDPSTDLAVIKIEGHGLNYSEFGNSDELRLGEWVLAVGNPLNLQSTVTAGIVSAKNRNIDLLTSSYNPDEKVFPIESFIQTDAAVNSGNSGGALVNKRGELVGINTAISSGTGYYTGYSFAVPSNIVKKVTYDLIKYGEVKRVQLGINIMDNNSEVQGLNNLSTNKGVVVTGVVADGNASNNGMKVKDIILAVGNQEVNSTSELQAKLAMYNPGDKVKIRLMRGEVQKDVDIVLH